MIEHRAFPRHRAEVMVDFALPDSKATGITFDVSLGGMFVRTSRIPEKGATLFLTLHLPKGVRLLVHGKVMRCFRSPALMRSSMPSGFGYRISRTPTYERFIDSLAPVSAKLARA